MGYFLSLRLLLKYPGIVKWHMKHESRIIADNTAIVLSRVSQMMWVTYLLGKFWQQLTCSPWQTLTNSQIRIFNVHTFLETSYCFVKSNKKWKSKTYSWMVDNQFVKIHIWEFVYVSAGHIDSRLQISTIFFQS